MEARKSAPNECCGLIVNGELFPCANAHSSPATNFAISAESYAEAEEKGQIEAVYHSHLGALESFSRHDVKACKESNVPWIIYHLPTGNFHYGDPTGNAPYEGREWIYGLNDCYALVRDFYAREFNITLDDFERGEDQEWVNPGWSMFVNNYEGQGFHEIPSPSQKGDIVLMRLNAPEPNHVGVMIGEGGRRFYHHLSDRPSMASIYGGFWAKVTVKVLRHNSL